MRKRLFEIIQKAKRHDTVSLIYDITIVAAALLSMLPLCFKTEPSWMPALELYAVYILFADYIFRWITYDYGRGWEEKTGWDRNRAFLLYPVMPMAILDLMSLLPTLGILGPGFLVLRLFRLGKLTHYSKSMQYIANVFKKQKKTLLAVLYIAIFYIFVSALIMFTFEPQSFDDFFESLYWATTALTTVGYGDVSPVTWVGRLISMVSSLFGIAVIALPAGIVTAGFVQEIDADKEREAAEEAENDANNALREHMDKANLEEMAASAAAQIEEEKMQEQEEAAQNET